MDERIPISERERAAGAVRGTGARILPGRFTAVQQAVGTARAHTEAAAYLRDFVERAKASGFVAELIARHQVVGLSVAPPA